MKCFLLLFAAVSALQPLAPAKALAFSKGGGGADYERPQPWFPSMTWNPKTMQNVEVCVSESEDFGLAPDAARRAVLDSFKVWGDYAARLRRENYDPFGSPDYIDVNFHLLDNCDGTEDLTIYLGSKAPEVTRLSEAYAEPLAFAHKTSNTSNKGYYGWGKGFLYVDTAAEIAALTDSYGFDWAKQNDILESLLVHELGHVLGCGHISGTIMDEDLAHQLFDSRYPHPPMVDQQRQLYVCDDNCAQDYVAIDEEFNGTNYDDGIDPFQFMTGRKSKGVRHAKFHFGVNEKSKSQSYMPEGYLTYSDDVGTYTFPVEFQAITNIVDQGTWFFGNLNQHLGGSYIGTIRRANGEPITVNVNRNNGLMNIFELTAVVKGEDYGLKLIEVNSVFKHVQYYGHP